MIVTFIIIDFKVDSSLRLDSIAKRVPRVEFHENS